MSDQYVSADFGTLPKSSEDFGKVPNVSEEFRTVPNTSEGFGSIPKGSEGEHERFQTPIVSKPENLDAYTMTVREAARVFENAGVARTERSIINWCQPNRQGIARLDCFFDENARKYYLTPQSVDRAVKEELAKAREAGTILPNPSERQPDASEPNPKRLEADAPSERGGSRLEEIERENRDLQIANRAKDFFIEQLQKDREAFAKEREQIIDKLVASSRQIGELETKLLQLEAPQGMRRVHVLSEELPLERES